MLVFFLYGIIDSQIQEFDKVDIFCLKKVVEK